MTTVSDVLPAGELHALYGGPDTLKLNPQSKQRRSVVWGTVVAVAIICDLPLRQRGQAAGCAGSRESCGSVFPSRVAI